ncbi:MAG: hypothetical protein ACLRZ2_03395 [Veillonella sp.]
MAVDSGHPFPFLTNHTINAIVRIFQIQEDGTKDYKIELANTICIRSNH